MPMNQFASQKEVIFMSYDDVIKSSKLYVLKKLLTDDYKPYYKNFIDYSKIENKTDEQLIAIISVSYKKNILEYLAIKEFDYEATYIDLLINDDNFAEKSKLLSMGDAIYVLLKQSFVSRIYIHTPVYDKSIHKELSRLYDMEKITYINGDFDKVIKDISKEEKITSYIINDITLINNLIDLDVVAYTSIICANMGYNYKFSNGNKTPMLLIDDIDELGDEKIFKLGMFDIYSKADYKF